MAPNFFLFEVAACDWPCLNLPLISLRPSLEYVDWPGVRRCLRTQYINELRYEIASEGDDKGDTDIADDDRGTFWTSLKDKLRVAASAYMEYKFLSVMDEVKKLSEPAWKYLNDIDPRQWSRAYFNPDVKSDLLINNLTKCFNSYILKARDKPITRCLR
ncbi:hypothetical protein CJ030_MR2G006067 [Morella rubra]|uniref:Uncharacterized protein n=1 Tax=Morella rubra TaxID=262757 RepID=A0A6A1WME2_9ROSI|nr:hypothetical protein CJ030_MR2G006067 [Morella rubra]